jgi:hypothetical protein
MQADKVDVMAKALHEFFLAHIDEFLGDREIDRARASAALVRIAESFNLAVPSSPECKSQEQTEPTTEPATVPRLHQFPFSLLGDALESLPQEQALDLIESEDLDLLAQRVWAVEYLSQDEVPLCNPSTASSHLRVRRASQRPDRRLPLEGPARRNPRQSSPRPRHPR